MSTFDGYVKEIPFIAVDYFDLMREPMPKIYFLSHFHTDHTVGLNDQWFRRKLVKFDRYIYSSAITTKFLEDRYVDIKDNLRELEIKKETVIMYKDEEETEKELNVIALPAGHCPGSLMFFFENKTNVLCTGDFRIPFSNLQRMEALYTIEKEVKKIDCIYLDSTFLSKDFEYFPTRKQSADVLCKTVQECLESNDASTVCLSLPAGYGAEYLLIELGRNIKQKIHVPSSKTLYQYIPDLDNIVSSEPHHKYRIHCRLSKICCCSNSSFTRTIFITALRWRNLGQNETPIIVHKNDVRMCASFHSSYTEIKEFLQYLKPDRVRLCVLPETEVDKAVMFELLKEIMDEYKNEKKETLMIDKLNCKKLTRSTSSGLLSSPPRNFKRKRFSEGSPSQP